MIQHFFQAPVKFYKHSYQTAEQQNCPPNTNIQVLLEEKQSEGRETLEANCAFLHTLQSFCYLVLVSYLTPLGDFSAVLIHRSMLSTRGWQPQHDRQYASLYTAVYRVAGSPKLQTIAKCSEKQHSGSNAHTRSVRACVARLQWN